MMKDGMNPGNKRQDDSLPLLYRAAQRGSFGKCRKFGQGCIAEALFVFLDGEPEQEAAEVLEEQYRARPWVCLTDSWEIYIRKRYPQAEVYRRYLMKPEKMFRLPEVKIPDEYRLAVMDQTVFEQHPFSHGQNYCSYDLFRTEGSGAVVYRDGEIVSSASSFLSMDGELELDVSTKEEYRGKGLATACAARMLQDCMERNITVHWDAQNEVSRHLAEKFGFEPEKEYSVYRVPRKGDHILRLRPYKACDAKTIIPWIGDEAAFRKWSADRFDHYPITAEDLNRHYDAMAESDSFYEMTAFDETGAVGHLIMRFTDEQKTILRFGFVIVDHNKRGMGYGKGMLMLAIRYAFEILKAKKITMGVFENNEQAYYCYRAAGFRDAAVAEPEIYHVMNENWKCRELEMDRSMFYGEEI